MTSSPLQDIRVVDLTRILAGPFATMILGDLGADVVKIERPGHGDDTRHWGPPFLCETATYFLSVNRNKRSLTLDLKSSAGSDVLWRLLENADVVVSNFRPGLMSELGFGYDHVSRRAPRAVYCVINGYGESGPRASRPAFDLVIQAESGLMDLTGPADGVATKAGISIADEVAGLYLVQGVLAALFDLYLSGAAVPDGWIAATPHGQLTSEPGAVSSVSHGRWYGHNRRRERFAVAEVLRGDGAGGARRR